MRSKSIVMACAVLTLAGSSVGVLRAIEEVPGLVDAARQGDTASLRSQLKSGARVTAASADGTTALHWAAFRGDLEEVELLLRAGANVAAKNNYGVAPLLLAAEAGSRAVIERLLKAGADPNTALPGGETALHTAARNGNPDVVEALLDHGATVDAVEATRAQTPLMWAAARGHVEAMKRLLDRGAKMNARSKMPPKPEGVARYQPYSARSVGGRGAASSSGRGVGTRNAAEQEIEADASAYGEMTALIMAVRENQLEAMRLLLDRGANVNDKAVVLARGGAANALFFAVANANYELAVELLKRGADPNDAGQGFTALHELAYGRSEVYATRRNGPGWTPGPQLKGRVSGLDLARELVRSGANINAKITQPMQPGYRNGPPNRGLGATPFFLAAKAGDFALMRVLAEMGADPHLTDASGQTPLLVALNGVAGEDQAPPPELLETVKLCLELKCDINTPGPDAAGRWTPLHAATARGLNEIVTLLVEHGASLTATLNPEGLFGGLQTNFDEKQKTPAGGWTPLAVAEQWEQTLTFRHADTAALLRKLMIERGIPIPAEVKSRETAKTPGQ